MEGADSDLAQVVNQGTIKWIVTGQGRLLIVPKFVGRIELAHTVASKGEPVLAAGEADIVGVAGYFIGLTITLHSGHYQPGNDRLSIGIDAFARIGITFS
jgi:hypothetical protein